MSQNSGKGKAGLSNSKTLSAPFPSKFQLTNFTRIIPRRIGRVSQFQTEVNAFFRANFSTLHSRCVISRGVNGSTSFLLEEKALQTSITGPVDYFHPTYLTINREERERERLQKEKQRNWRGTRRSKEHAP